MAEQNVIMGFTITDIIQKGLNYSGQAIKFAVGNALEETLKSKTFSDQLVARLFGAKLVLLEHTGDLFKIGVNYSSGNCDELGKAVFGLVGDVIGGIAGEIGGRSLGGWAGGATGGLVGTSFFGVGSVGGAMIGYRAGSVGGAIAGGYVGGKIVEMGFETIWNKTKVLEDGGACYADIGGIKIQFQTQTSQDAAPKPSFGTMPVVGNTVPTVAVDLSNPNKPTVTTRASSSASSDSEETAFVPNSSMKWVSTTSGTTGVITEKIVNESGATVLSAAPGQLISQNPDTGVVSTPWGAGGKEYFDPSTQKRIYVYADNSGFVVGQNGASDTYFDAGSFNQNANGTINITPTGSSTPITLFGTTNTVNINTSVGAATGTGTTDAASSVSNSGNGLISTGSTSVSGTGNVNNDSGNTATKNYFVTDGIRPGNNNLGVTGVIGNAKDPLGVILNGGVNTGTGAVVAGGVTNTQATAQTRVVPVDPLILDLDGGGVTLTSFGTNPVMFDVDNDRTSAGGRTQEQTGWMAAGEGMVVHDLDGNGKIDGINETLSEYYNGQAGAAGSGTGGTKPYANGFAALKSLDSNNDTSISLAATVQSYVSGNTDGNVAQALSTATLGVRHITGGAANDVRYGIAA